MKILTEIYNIFLKSKGVNTDSRTLRSGELYFALKGENFNGNDFILKAIEMGCIAAIADENREEFQNQKQVLIVENSLEMLQSIAREHRRNLKIPIIGLTGSNGKTTSKELLAAALSRQYNVFATKGNLNNHIGVALSLLAIRSEHEIAVIEMGANHQKEIKFLCSIVQPDAGYITNIGMAHLEGFGGEEGVYIGKKELFDFLHSTHGTIFCNLDDDKVVRAASGMKYLSYGKSEKSTFQGDFKLIENGLLVTWWRDNNPSLRHQLKVQLTGSYNFSNVLSAVTVARFYGVSAEKIQEGIEGYIPTNNRSQIAKSLRGNTIIIDCYNANPSSMSAALENVAIRPEKNKVIILGDMLEIGDVSSEKHLEIRNQASQIENSQIYLVGQEFIKISLPEDKTFDATESLKEFLQSNPIKDSLILLKGSRKMKLETLLELL